MVSTIGSTGVYPTLYRKRLIPEECVLLKDDEILVCNEDIIVTRWKALKPKKDLHHGYSCYFLKKGYKVSKLYSPDEKLVYWYCDIVKVVPNEEKNEIVFEDLLLDVVIYEDGHIEVLDADELADALEQKIIPQEYGYNVDDGKFIIDFDLLRKEAVFKLDQFYATE